MSERPPVNDEVERISVVAMTKLVGDPKPAAISQLYCPQLYCHQIHLKQKLLASAMHALKQTVKDDTAWHVFIQDFAASLNRAELLSNTNEQLSREWAYRYIRGV